VKGTNSEEKRRRGEEEKRRRGELKIWEEKLEEKYFVKNVEGNNKEEKRRF
jgi:hypothetical protein